MAIYAVRGSLTVGAAAPKDFLSIVAPANSRIKIVGVLIGNTAATAAQGVGWQLITATTDAVGTAFTPLAHDRDAPAARSTAKSTITTNAAGTVNVLDEFGFDIVGTYVLWFPPGKEIIIPNSGIFVVRKNVGADTTTWYVTVFFEE